MQSRKVFVLALAALGVEALRKAPKNLRDEASRYFSKRQAAIYPAPVQNYTTITSPNGSSIRYKEPGQAGVCETTPGVGSYSGYIDLAPNMHSFFWYMRSDPDFQRASVGGY